MTIRVRMLLAAAALPAASFAGLGVPAVPRAQAEQGMAYLRTLGYQGVAFTDKNGDGLCQMDELTLKDFQDGARDTVLWKELRNLYKGLENLSVQGTLRFGDAHMYVLVRSDKGINAVEPKSGDLVFKTWFQDLSDPVEVDGRHYAVAKGQGGKAWVDLTSGGKYKGEFFNALDSIQAFEKSVVYVCTNGSGQKNVVRLPAGKPVGKTWYSRIDDVSASGGDVYMLAGTAGTVQWVDRKGRSIQAGLLTEIKGLYFADGLGALWGKNAAGEWGNVSLKGKVLGKGFQRSPVGPLQRIADGAAFKSCTSNSCTFVDAKSGDDILPKTFSDLGDKVWHFEGRDVLLAKDALGRWSYVYGDAGDPLTGSWYTSIQPPTIANALFSFVGTKPSGQSLKTIVTPEGNIQEKPFAGSN
ncbi:MAG: hypothetical protein H6686_10435 [Fibrobacteria bacterium]|nr:hypothetical protein [Fibrobacteria bacterium]